MRIHYPSVGAINNPIVYVTAASPSPTSVISVPLLSHERPVTTTLDAPTIKCASVLTINEIINPSIPEKKINGMTGTAAPIAVLIVALVAAFHWFGNVFSDNPNSSWVNVVKR